MVRAGYKQTEVGVKPEDWKVSSVGEAASVKTGPFGSALHEKDYVEDGTPIITVEHLGERGIDYKNLPMVSEFDKARLKSYILQKGDIAFSRVGSVDRNALVSSCEDGWLFSGRLLRVRVKPNGAVPEYLSYHFHSEQFKQRVVSVAVGQTMASINTKILSSILITIPPSRSEQQAIADALSDADALIESLEKLIAKKRLIKQGAMQELLTGKKRLQGFSGKWITKTLGELFYFSGGVSASRDQLSTNGICYLHYGDIHLSSRTFVDIDSDASSLPRLDIPLGKVPLSALLKDGDIVFVDASEDNEGASKHVVISNKSGIPYISGLHTIVAKAKGKDTHPLYRRYCFQTEDIKRQFVFYAVGTKVTGISKTSITKIALTYPPIGEEQLAIATILTDMDSEIDSLEHKLTKARQIKQGMMQELLTGRIRLVQPSLKTQKSAASDVQDGVDRGHNKHFNDAVMIAVLTKNFGSVQYPLGRKRYTKLSYCLYRKVEGAAQGYLKKAAGPYNPTTKYGGAEKIALSKNYIQESQTSQGQGFVASSNIAEAEKYFMDWYGAEPLKWLSSNLKFKKNDELELIATVDAAMVDLSASNQPINVQSVKQVLANNAEWLPKLSRPIFSDQNIENAIGECQKLFAMQTNKPPC
jgi:type I restriction enzyme S subunit